VELGGILPLNRETIQLGGRTSMNLESFLRMSILTHLNIFRETYVENTNLDNYL
jgi:hypothetical protein